MKQDTVIFDSSSEADTIKFAKRFAGNLKSGDILFLEGDLGAGKTTFTKGLAQALKVKSEKVVSPTFILMNYYKGKLPMYHFDLYRLENPQELKSINFDEYFYGDGISIIEWPKRLGAFAPTEYWLITFKHQGENSRQICISYPSNPQRTISL